MIFKSSANSYHVLFNRKVIWRKNIHIMSWTAIESQNPKLKDYVLMQGIKESSTLRAGPKAEKPSPRIVYRFGKQDGEIGGFLKKRREIKDTITKSNGSFYYRSSETAHESRMKRCCELLR